MSGFLHIFAVCIVLYSAQVSGLDFSSTPQSYVVGSEGTLTLRCSVTETFDNIYNIKILRATTPGSSDSELLASFSNGVPTLNGNLQNNRDFEVSGNRGGSPPFIEVLMNINKMTCSDARSYSCEANIEVSPDSVLLNQNMTIDAFVTPTMTSIEGSKNNGFVDGGTLTFKAPFDEGDILELTCRANIGSLQGTKIQWHKTSETSSSFIPYNPVSGIIDGTASSDLQCGYTRTSTISYNVTAADANYNNLAFECYVRVNGYPSSSLTPGGQFQTANTLQYYLDITAANPKGSPSVASAGSGSNTGAIVGGVIGGLVFIVLIVVLVWFLWFRRQGGETYTTKEEYGAENPNIAPPVDTNYATVEKKSRRGHENKGLDEPHESRRRHYNNVPGKTNFGMDRDADDYDSRDGSPSFEHQGIGHMGLDPVDGRIGTGV